MGKKKIPNTLTAEILLSRKTIYGDKKKDPIWVVLEREMRANADQKPYNEKVGAWLKFLRDLKYFYHNEKKRLYKKLLQSVGPPWYFEFSLFQRSIIHSMRANIQADIVDSLPTRVRKSLQDLGVTKKFSNKMLMSAVLKCEGDTGIFFWQLYNTCYKLPPSVLRDKYDMNAKLMMSAMVFVDLEECKQELVKVMAKVPPPPPPPPKQFKKYYQPNVKFGEYLQKMYVPNTSKHPIKPVDPPKPLPLVKKVKLRSDESYELLAKQSTWLAHRRQRHHSLKPAERKCKYKFWHPPSSMRNTDPKLRAYILAVNMLKERARPRHNRHKLPFENIQLLIKNVAYCNGHPVYCLEAIVNMPTDYIVYNGGYVKVGDEYILNLVNYCKYPRDDVDMCSTDCDCLNKWNDTIMELMNASKCICGHGYDYGNEGKLRTKYFHPPSNGVEYWIDYAEVYQTDPWADAVMKQLDYAFDSRTHSATRSSTTISPNKLKNKELLAAFLSELSDTPLMIPHLPKANLLNNLQELVRNRVKGPYPEKTLRNFALKSVRKQVQLKHMDFRARAYNIRLTKKEIKEINFSHRPMIQKMFHTLLDDFESRNRQKLMEQTRILWPLMDFDICGSDSFLNAFFTYMPGRWKDVHLLNPYCTHTTRKCGGKTCLPVNPDEPRLIP